MTKTKSTVEMVVVQRGNRPVLWWMTELVAPVLGAREDGLIDSSLLLVRLSFDRVEEGQGTELRPQEVLNPSVLKTSRRRGV